MFKKELENKLKSFKDLEEYKDALMYFDIDKGEKSFEDYDQVPQILESINKKYGDIIPIMRMNYLLMKDLKINRYDAQRIMQIALSHGIVSWQENANFHFRTKNNLHK